MAAAAVVVAGNWEDEVEAEEDMVVPSVDVFKPDAGAGMGAGAGGEADRDEDRNRML